IETCANCHARIDPPGFALENFDVIGGWRDKYRTSGNGEEGHVDGRRMPYQHGRSVDPAAVLADGRSFRNIDDVKELLLADKDRLGRALTIKLLTYATGGAPDGSDHPHVEAILETIRNKNYGLRSLIHEIVQSAIFQNK